MNGKTANNIKTFFLSLFLIIINSDVQCQSIHKSVNITLGTSKNLKENLYLSTLDAGIDFQRYRWGAMGVELNLYRFWDKKYNSLGIGARPGGQFFFISRTLKLNTY